MITTEDFKIPGVWALKAEMEDMLEQIAARDALVSAQAAQAERQIGRIRALEAEVAHLKTVIEAADALRNREREQRLAELRNPTKFF